MSHTTPLAIVCVPRSGSLYTAKLLRAAGVAISWERYGPAGIVAWQAAAPDPHPPFSARTWRRPDVVLSLVRHPLRTIGSIMANALSDTSGPRVIEYARRWILLPPDLPRLTTAAYLFVGWSQLIAARQPAAYCRVEDDPAKIVAWVSRYVPIGPPIEPPPQPGTHRAAPYSVPSLAELARAAPGWIVEHVVRHAGRFQYDLAESTKEHA